MRRWALRLVVTLALTFLSAFAVCGVGAGAWVISSRSGARWFAPAFAAVLVASFIGSALLPGRRERAARRGPPVRLGSRSSPWP